MNIFILGVRIIEDSDNRGSDNRGCTILANGIFCYSFPYSFYITVTELSISIVILHVHR